jgi:hypothetical protein
MKKNKMAGYMGERQAWIRGSIFCRMFWILGGLLIADAVVTGALEYRWVTEGLGGALLFVTVMYAWIIEATLRDAYFPPSGGGGLLVPAIFLAVMAGGIALENGAAARIADG